MLKIGYKNLVISMPPYGDFACTVCDVNTWEEMTEILRKNDISGMRKIINKIIFQMPCKSPLLTSCGVFIENYITAVADIINNNIDVYKLPSCENFSLGEEDEDDEDLLMPIHTYEYHLVHKYTGLSFAEIGKLDFLTFRYYLADAAKVQALKRGDGKGIKYLNACYNEMHGISTGRFAHENAVEIGGI